jgi:hypothetical protein
MSYAVMNNEDLRREIWSYLRKEPKVECMYCKDVCVWDKKVIKEYYEDKIMDIVRYKCVYCYVENVIDLCIVS